MFASDPVGDTGTDRFRGVGLRQQALVEGYLLHLAEDAEATFLSHEPMRVLFGRSGAGKSAILNGIAVAVSALPSLAPGRGFRGSAGVVLKVSHDETAEEGHRRFLSESGAEPPDEQRIAQGEDPANVQAQRLLQEKIPGPESLPPLLAAAFIGDQGMENAAQHITMERYVQTHYSQDRVNDEVRLAARSLIGANDLVNLFHLVEPSDLSAAIEATDAILRTRHLLFRDRRTLEVVLDVEEISEETREAFETLERSSHIWVPPEGGSFGHRLSPLYDVARAWKRCRGRFVQLGWSFTVDCSEHSEYFESGRPDGTRWLADYRYPCVINLGGDAEQSVDDFVEKLTEWLPDLHDRLFTNVLLADSPPGKPGGVSDEEKALFRSGLLARMAPSPAHRRMGFDPRMRKDEWDRWMWVSGDGGVRVKPTVETCCTMLERRVNELLPEFLSAHGQVGVFVEPLEQWSVSNRPRLSICLWQGDKPVPLMRLGSGIRRWILSVIDWAFQDLKNSYVSNVSKPSTLTSIEQGVEMVEGLKDAQLEPVEPLGVLIVDEPELHLDQRLQIQVAEWLKNLKDQGTSVVLASHSPAFLTYQAHEAVLTGVVHEGGSPTTTDMTSDLLSWCKEFSLIGLNNADRILLASGYIVVEGPHDSRVLREFFCSELEEARVELLHLMGTRDTEQSLIDSEYLTSLGKPIGILLDKIKRNVDEIFRKEEKWLTNEEKFAKRLVRGLRNRGVKHHVTGHIFPDVMCCLPEEAVRKAFPKANFPGWKELGDRYSAKRPDGNLKVPPVNYKIFALREMELSIGATDFIDGVLAYCDENAKPHASLRQAVDELLAHVTQPFADSRAGSKG